MWQQMEANYLPWRLRRSRLPCAGGLWQAKLTSTTVPFYYIDYTLALCCALQFWTKSRQNSGRARQRLPRPVQAWWRGRVRRARSPAKAAFALRRWQLATRGRRGPRSARIPVKGGSIIKLTLT